MHGYSQGHQIQAIDGFTLPFTGRFKSSSFLVHSIRRLVCFFRGQSYSESRTLYHMDWSPRTSGSRIGYNSTKFKNARLGLLVTFRRVNKCGRCWTTHTTLPRNHRYMSMRHPLIAPVGAKPGLLVALGITPTAYNTTKS